MKQLVIISGVTGAIGSSLFSEFTQSDDVVVYGISRKAFPVSSFIQNNGRLPLATLICSISSLDRSGFVELVKHIDFEHVQRVVYIHALGLYPFEVDVRGDRVMQHDFDKDGIDDRVVKLTYTAFVEAVELLSDSYPGRVSCLLFGSLADRYKPSVHRSWWMTIEQTKIFMKTVADERVTMLVCNISSVMSPHEVITRPYVFSQTDAVQSLWLHPYELAQFVVLRTYQLQGGYHEFEKFRIRPDFDPDYYSDNKFTPRKVSELYFIDR